MASQNRSASPHFHTIKAVFEAPNASHARPIYRITRTSSPIPPTNKNVPNPALNLISRETSENEPDTIDTVFGLPTVPITAPSRFHTRTPVYLKPAWIGPARASRPATPGIMAHKVTITYSSPGLQPPVYVLSSLSEPDWEILEMDVSRLPDGELEFAKTFHAEEGEYQYKFRLGPGDWWVCDEGKPIVDDGMGNRNNLLVVKDDFPVKHPKGVSESAKPAVTDFTSPTQEPIAAIPPLEISTVPQQESVQVMLPEEHAHHMAPLFAHESNSHPNLELPPEDVPVNFSRMDTQPVPDVDDDGDVEPSHHQGSPLFRHETFSPGSRAEVPSPDYTPGVDEDEEDPFDHPPLMKHEPAGPDAVESEHAPLFSHESVGMSSPPLKDHTRTPESRRASQDAKHDSLEPAIPKEADLNDPNLEHFPTHHEGIMSSLRRASLRSAVEEHEDASSAPSHSASHSSRRSSLPSVREDEEEEEVIAHAPDDKVASLDTQVEDIVAEDSQASKPSERPAALMTPPRTPDSTAPTVGKASHALDLKHHQNDTKLDPADQPSRLAPNMDGEGTPQTEEVAQSDTGEGAKEEKRGGQGKMSDSVFSLDAVVGLGLTVVVGAAAAWLAYKMHGSVDEADGVLHH